MSERTDRLEELSEDYYRLFGRLSENAGFMEAKQTTEVSKRFFNFFEEDLILLSFELGTSYQELLFEFKTRYNGRFPRRNWFRKNKAMKTALKEIGAELSAYYAAREAAYNARYAPDEDEPEPTQETPDNHNVGVPLPKTDKEPQALAKPDEVK